MSADVALLLQRTPITGFCTSRTGPETGLLIAQAVRWFNMGFPTRVETNHPPMESDNKENRWRVERHPKDRIFETRYESPDGQ